MHSAPGKRRQLVLAGPGPVLSSCCGRAIAGIWAVLSSSCVAACECTGKWPWAGRCRVALQPVCCWLGRPALV